jgi:hypothetical protein
MKHLCLTYRKSHDDEEGEGSSNFIHMCFSYNMVYVFQVDVCQVNLSGLCLLGVKEISGLSQVEWQSDR